MNRRSLLLLVIAALAFGSQHLPADWSRLIPFPIPIVQPQANGAWIILVEETSQRTPAAAAFVQNVDYLADLANRGLKWRQYDVDQHPAKQYVLKAQEVGLPALVVLDPAGKVLGGIHLEDATDVDSFIQKTAGK